MRAIGQTAEALEAARKVSSTDEEYFRAATGLLEALCNELAKDAERYRWISERNGGERYDAWVDEAMKRVIEGKA